MSADNYMAVKEVDGVWHSWMVLGGYEDDDWDPLKHTGGLPHGRFSTFQEAYAYAQKECEEGVVEYGIHVLSPIPKERT